MYVRGHYMICLCEVRVKKLNQCVMSVVYSEANGLKLYYAVGILYA